MATTVTYGADEHGEPQATFTVTGAHDIYRLAFTLSHAQCEFAEQGRGMLRFLAAAAPRALAYLDKSMGGGRVERHRLAVIPGRAVTAKIARRSWKCWACGATIRLGDLYVEHRMFPGNAAYEVSTPTSLRVCLACAADDHSREALGAWEVQQRAAEVA